MRLYAIALALFCLALAAGAGAAPEATQNPVQPEVLVGHTDWILPSPSVDPAPEALERVQDAFRRAVERYGPPPLLPVHLAFQTPDSTIVDAVSVCQGETCRSGCRPGLTFYVFPAQRPDGRPRLDQTDRFLQW
ncbi:MAG: hypothetical protein ACUVS5_03970 [Anaerolineae bacterium]